MHAHYVALRAPSAAPVVFYRLKSDFDASRSDAIHILSAGSPFTSPAASSAGSSPTGASPAWSFASSAADDAPLQCMSPRQAQQLLDGGLTEVNV